MLRGRQVLGRWMGLAPDWARGVLRVVGLVVMVGVLVSGMAASGTTNLDSGLQVQAVPYSDVVRFVVQGEGVATLKVEILDLTGQRLFDSGPVTGRALDWPMTTESGERVAHGIYLYMITVWDSQGEILEQKAGKLALVPGGVGLGQAPPLLRNERALQERTGPESKAVPLTYNIYDDLDVHGHLMVRGHGTVAQINPGTTTSSTHIQGGTYDNNGAYLNFYGDDHPDAPGWVHIGYGSFEESSSNAHFQIEFAENGTRTPVMRILANGNVGIGTTSPTTELDVSGHIRASVDAGIVLDPGFDCPSGCSNWIFSEGYTGFGSSVPLVLGGWDPDTFEVRVEGDLNVTGTKNFVQDHPLDPQKQIVYTSLEGPEAGTYIRGTAELVNGEAVIELPEHFSLVTSDEGLTVQLTPLGEWLQLYVVEKNTQRIIVREANGKNGQFDYMIQGVRKGYENYQVIQEKRGNVRN